MTRALLKTPQPGGWRGFTTALKVAALRVSLWFSPRPAAHQLRRLFDEQSATRETELLSGAPDTVFATLDLEYDAHPDARLDVYLPVTATASENRLPVVVWLHGTAFVDGRKEHPRGYLRRIAAEGFVVVAPGYSLAPETSYPIPVRQILAALAWVAGNGERFHMDPTRVVLAGDSAGAQLAAQVAAVITDRELAAELAMTSIPVRGPRGIAVFGGLFDPTRARDDSPYGSLLTSIGWAYIGRRDYAKNARLLADLAVRDRVTADFPPAFISAGDGDPLLRQSQDLTVAYIEADASVETYFPENRASPLPHDFAFDFEREEAGVAFERLTGFLHRVTQ